jgi:hypothetical protein
MSLQVCDYEDHAVLYLIITTDMMHAHLARTLPFVQEWLYGSALIQWEIQHSVWTHFNTCSLADKLNREANIATDTLLQIYLLFLCFQSPGKRLSTIDGLGWAYWYSTRATIGEQMITWLTNSATRVKLKRVLYRTTKARRYGTTDKSSATMTNNILNQASANARNIDDILSLPCKAIMVKHPPKDTEVPIQYVL